MGTRGRPPKSQLEKSIDAYYRQLDRMESKALGQIEKAYGIAMREIESEIAKIQRKILADAAKGTADVYRQIERLESLQRQANQTMRQFGGNVAGAVENLQTNAGRAATAHIKGVLGDAYGGGSIGLLGDFELLPQTTLNELTGTLSDGSPLTELANSYGDSAGASLRTEMIKGISQGLNPLTVAKAWQKGLSATKAQANTIARTEMMRVSREASRRTMERNSDVVSEWQWYCALDSRTCPVCWAMHGTKHALKTKMATHPNCFIGSTLVTLTSPIEAVFRRVYKGEMIRVTLASGDIIEGTPNHPMLTPKGWVDLGKLQPPDDLICDRTIHRDAKGIEPKVENEPSTIQEIFKTWSKFGVVSRVDGSPIDFHGDGGEGDVDIVWPASVLGSSGVSPVGQGFEQFNLSDTHKSDTLSNRSILCSQHAGIPRIDLPPSDVVSGFGAGGSLLGSHSGHADSIGFGASPNGYSGFNKASANNGTGNEQIDTQGKLGLPVEVSTDQIIGIERYPFHGFVYNLQTEGGWYGVGNSISHIGKNCRCTMLPVTKTFAELGLPGVQEAQEDERLRTSGRDLFKKQPHEVQRSVLGPSALRAYEKGDVSLRDFVGEATSPKWGKTRYKRSLRAILGEQRATAYKVPTRTVPRAVRTPKGKAAVAPKIAAPPPSVVSRPLPPAVPIPPRPPTIQGPPAWQPTMSRDEATRFAGQGDLQRPLFHVTSEDGAKGIGAEEFDLSRNQWGRVWGDGVYMSDSAASEAMYSSAFSDPRKLELRVFSRKTLPVDISGRSNWGHDDVMDAIPGLGRYEARRKLQDTISLLNKSNQVIIDEMDRVLPRPANMNSAQSGDWFAKRTAFLDQARIDGTYVNNPVASGLTRTLEDYGYDAIDLKDEPHRSSVGGNQVIVFDPKRVVVVKD